MEGHQNIQESDDWMGMQFPAAKEEKKKALEVDVKCSPFFFTFFSMKGNGGWGRTDAQQLYIFYVTSPLLSSPAYKNEWYL